MKTRLQKNSYVNVSPFKCLINSFLYLNCVLNMNIKFNTFDLFG